MSPLPRFVFFGCWRGVLGGAGFDDKTEEIVKGEDKDGKGEVGEYSLSLKKYKAERRSLQGSH